MQKKKIDMMRGARRMNQGSSVIALILLMALTSSCYWRVNEMEKVEPPPEEISYEVDIQPIWDNAPGGSGAGCTRSGCHEGTVPPDLTQGVSYNNLVLGGYVNTNDPPSSVIYTTITAGGSMEVYASDNDRAFVLAWIEQGAKNN